MLDLDQFIERAALREYLGNVSRFEAETAAALEQGLPRWKAVKQEKEASHANGRGFTAGVGGDADEMGGRRDAHLLPKMQLQPKEAARPMPERQPEAGRDCDLLLALRTQRGVPL